MGMREVEELKKLAEENSRMRGMKETGLSEKGNDAAKSPKTKAETTNTNNNSSRRKRLGKMA
ncbi:hypothetical protein GX48_08431, partial [Paracoccidioides brasiliensis]